MFLFYPTTTVHPLEKTIVRDQERNLDLYLRPIDRRDASVLSHARIHPFIVLNPLSIPCENKGRSMGFRSHQASSWMNSCGTSPVITNLAGNVSLCRQWPTSKPKAARLQPFPTIFRHYMSHVLLLDQLSRSNEYLEPFTRTRYTFGCHSTTTYSFRSSLSLFSSSAYP
jgi:hypothetical protein